MGKVGILTYHTGYNYGASLQAYALQKVIREMGIDCETIHFETERFVNSREMFAKHPKRLKEIVKIASRIPYYRTLKKRQAMFDSFTSESLNLSPLYRTEQEVIDHADAYDCIVCGSDQIWNLSQIDAPAANLLYYLNFPKSQRRVSYAASMGHWVREAPAHEGEILPWLKQFDALSMRETSGVEYLRSLGLPCELCLDPTVLLDAEDYEPVCAERLIPERYVLLFSWNCNDDVIAAAKRVGKELNLPIYNIVPPPRAMGKGIPRKLDVGPSEFLSMVQYADFVVTNSFHGTAFSTTYQKPYVSIVSGKADLRMSSLLEQLGLSDHLVTWENMDVSQMLQTDYAPVQAKKQALREPSLRYLRRALEAGS